MHHIVIVYKHGRHHAGIFAEELKGWIEERGARAHCRENPEEIVTSRPPPGLQIPADAEVAIVLGGVDWRGSRHRLHPRRLHPKRATV